MKLTQTQISEMEKNLETSDDVFEAIQTAIDNTCWMMGINRDDIEIDVDYVIKIKTGE